jgi:hypothetical protein
MPIREQPNYLRTHRAEHSDGYDYLRINIRHGASRSALDTRLQLMSRAVDYSRAESKQERFLRQVGGFVPIHGLD